MISELNFLINFASALECQFMLIVSLFISCCLIQTPNIIPTSATAQDSKVITQTPSGILEQAIQTIGGRSVIESIDSFEMHGVMKLPNGKPVIEIELSTAKGGKVLGVLSFIGLGQSRFGSDGLTSWEQSFQADQTPTWILIDQATLSQKVKQINWVEWLTTLPTHLATMNVNGKTYFDDEMCYEVSYQTNSGAEQTAYFSCKTKRPKGRRTSENTNNGKTTVDVYFRDWKEVDSLMIFHTVIFSRDGVEVSFSMDSIEIDTAPSSIFVIPQEVKQILES